MEQAIVDVKTYMVNDAKTTEIFQRREEFERFGDLDRLINNAEDVNEDDIDLPFRENFRLVRQLILNAYNYLHPDGETFLREKWKSLDFGRILSKADSSSQSWHHDFSGGWRKYFAFVERTKLTPLSVLHFPEG